MPGGRPPKPIQLVQGHRTKAEKEVRKKAEISLLTGTPLKEWPEVKESEVAHKEFNRLKKLLKTIGHNDDLYGAVINTHCKLKAEENQMLEARDQFIKTLDKLDEEYANDPERLPFADYMKLKVSVQGQIIGCDKAIMNKRKLMMDISKENIMTIQSALRSIPKKEEPKQQSPMAAFLGRRQANNT